MKKMMFVLLFFFVLSPVRAFSQNIQNINNSVYLMVSAISHLWMYNCWFPPDDPQSGFLRCEVYQRNQFREAPGGTAQTYKSRGLVIDYNKEEGTGGQAGKTVSSIKITDVSKSLFNTDYLEVEVDGQEVTLLKLGACDGDHCEAGGELTDSQLLLIEKGERLDMFAAGMLVERFYLDGIEEPLEKIKEWRMNSPFR